MSGSAPFVPVMQTTYFGDRENIKISLSAQIARNACAWETCARKANATSEKL